MQFETKILFSTSHLHEHIVSFHEFFDNFEPDGESWKFNHN